METKLVTKDSLQESLPDNIWVWMQGDDEPISGMFLECDDPANPGTKYVKLKDVNYHLLEVLKELCGLMDDVRTGNYTPDSFTCQPARELINIIEGDEKATTQPQYEELLRIYTLNGWGMVDNLENNIRTALFYLEGEKCDIDTEEECKNLAVKTLNDGLKTIHNPYNEAQQMKKIFAWGQDNGYTFINSEMQDLLNILREP